MFLHGTALLYTQNIQQKQRLVKNKTTCNPSQMFAKNCRNGNRKFRKMSKIAKLQIPFLKLQIPFAEMV